jgi:DHA1 family bicyclomycin/chloramphenicol resistance-like MFS transporter
VTKRRHFFLVLVLGSLTALGPFSIDMYLPGFPQIARSLHTTTGAVSHSLSSFFIGLACGQLLYGLLMDRFGRKKPLYLGLALYVAASVGCALAPSVEWLIALRFVQALGSSAAGVAAMAMVRDLFPVKDSAKVFASLIIVVAASPMLAPTAGSYLTAAFGWPSVFVVLLAIAAVLLVVVVLVLPESHQRHPDFSLHPGSIVKNFISVAREPQFYTYALGGSLAFAALFAYVAGSPMAFMEYFGLDGKAYGRIFAFLSIGFIGFSQLNSVLLRRYRSERIVIAALWGQVSVAVLFLLGAASGCLGLGATIALLFLLLVGIGLTYPNTSALSLAPFSRNAGTAAAFMGALQWGFGSLSSYGVGALHRQSLLPLAAVIAASSVLGLLVVQIGRRNVVHPIGPSLAVQDPVPHF